MYLKRLELQGFKSFAPRTTLEFSPGVTAIVGPNGSGKCLIGSSRVTLADGREVTIRELVDDALAHSTACEKLDDGELTRENPQAVRVISLNPASLRLEARPVSAFVRRTSPDHLLRIRTRSGREVTATPYHPLFTLDRGQLRTLRADEAQAGIRIATPRMLPTEPAETRFDPQAVMRAFTEDDRVYVSGSAELRQWAAEAHSAHGTWTRWAELAHVSYTQVHGLMDGQGVNAAVLTRLADVAPTPPPVTGALKSHGATTIQFPTAMSTDLARFLGLAIAEGRISREGNVWFVNSDVALNDEYVRLGRILFGLEPFRRRYKPTVEDIILFSRTLGFALERLFGFGVRSKSADKCVPPQVFAASQSVQWAFLSGLFEGDGHVHLSRSKKTGKMQVYIEYVSASKTLASGVVSLLLRLGIVATLRAVEKCATNSPEKRRRTYYSVYIYGVEQAQRAARQLSFIGQKQVALDALQEVQSAPNPNRDLIPGVTPLVREAAAIAKVSVKRHRNGRAKLAAYCEGRCEASRDGLLEVAQQIEELSASPAQDNERLQVLRTLATSDVFWDEIISVEYVALSDPWVYDLCIAETHNFVAENIIVHNSNVADAIRWVLGEQSMRQLRGKKSDDVIFAGGDGRAQMQMAQVGLTLDNTSGWIPSEFTEIAIARRSFRSGETEYLSNAQRVRLKDVLFLLAQARIGHDSYTVVGQGMIDQALSLRADERRALFEDAAGIRGFQAQRNEAEQRLNLTQTNLSRLRDIIGEIEPRLGPLAEQARRAHEFSGAREELTRLLGVWYRRQWRDLLAARATAEASESQLGARIQELQASLAREDEAARDLRERRETLIGEIGVLRRERGEASGRLQTAERDLAVGRERLASLGQQRDDLDGEREQQVEAVDVARAHVGALEAQIAQAEERAGAVAAEVDRLERDQHGARQEQEQAEAQLRGAQRDAIQAQARIGAAQSELGRLQRQLGERNRALATRREAVTTAHRKLDAANAQHAERHAAFEQARAEVEALVAEREALARETLEGQAEIERLRAEVADAERERKALAERLALLEEWRRNLDGLDAGAQALLRAPEAERPALLGVVSQLISVTPGMELAVEAALGPFLQAVVVARAEDARAAAAWLRAGAAGHALFLWAADEAERAPGEKPESATDGETLGLVADAISAEAGVRAALTRALGGALIVRDLATAERLTAEGARSTPIVTLAGEVVCGRAWMRGGAVATRADDASDASALGRERDLRRLPAKIERQARDIEERGVQLAAATERQSVRRARAEKLQKTVQGAEARAQELARAVTALQRDQERAESEAHVSESVAEQLAAETQGIEQEVAATVERVAEQEAAQRLAAERVEDLQAEVDEIATRNGAQSDDLNRARMSLALHKQEVTTLGQRADQLRGQLREFEAQLSRRDERLKSIAEQREQLETSTSEQEGAITILRERVRSLGETLRAHDETQAEMERQIASLERGQSAERQELARLEVEYRRAIVDAQRARDAQETLAAQIREELGAEEEEDPLLAIVGATNDADDGAEPETQPTPEEQAKMRRQIDSLRSRLKHLGGYDPEAPQQYAELKTRYDFLSSQMADMQTASNNLRQIIAELDATMKRQFVETFHKVNERFQRHFVTLFSGGAARLELTAPRREQADDEDDEEAAPDERTAPRKTSFGGVEVFVQIPGKRVQDLSLLSGGERAMVSAALLFALLETNPPPFCLLDEVDAALDEANVVRFCDILKQLAERTQFIVITHNRVTMTHANAIYGVSMGADSVSRVLSMRLAEVPLAL